MVKLKTRNVERSSFPNYLKKATECRRAAVRSYGQGDWNAAAICAIHCCISACDAICTYALGLRYTGERHTDAIALLLSIKPNDERYKSNAARLSRIINTKNMAEYEERLVFRKEAEKAIK